MAEMRISNTLVNDTSTGEIAYVDQVKDRILKKYIAENTDYTTTDKGRIPSDIKAEIGVFQERLNEFFLDHWVAFQRFMLDEGVDPSIIDSWYEVKRFLEGLDDDTARWLKTKLNSLDTAIASIDQDGIGTFDISAYNNVEGTYATYANLDTALSAVPIASRRSGMTIRYIDSSTDEYKQYRYMLQYSDTTSGNNDFVDMDNWTQGGVFSTGESVDNIGIDSEPTAESENLVKSGGVNKIRLDLGSEILDLSTKLVELSIADIDSAISYTDWIDGGYYIDGKFIESVGFSTLTLLVDSSKIYHININVSGFGVTGLCLFNEENLYLGGLQSVFDKDFVFVGVNKIILSKANISTDTSIVSYTNKVDISWVYSNIIKLNSLINWNSLPISFLQDVVVSGNLFKIAKKIEDGKYITAIKTDKTLQYTSSTSYVTYLIPVNGLSTYLFTHVRFGVLMVDETHAIDNATLLQQVSSISSVGANYIAFSFNTSNYPVNSYQIGIGNLQQNVSYEIPELKLNGDNLFKQSVGIDKVSFTKLGKNIFNINDTECLLGKYLVGNVEYVGNFNVTGYIKVKPNTYYQCSYNDSPLVGTFLARFVCQYGSNKNYLSGKDLQPSKNLNYFQTDSSANYIRISVADTSWEKYQVEEGIGASPWEPYKHYIDSDSIYVEDIEPSIFKMSSKYKGFSGSSTLVQNETLSLPRTFTRRRMCMSALISGTDNLSVDVLVGLGYEMYNGGWIELTSDKLIVHKYLQSDSYTEYTHGLTLGADTIIFYDSTDGNANIKVISDGNIYSQQIEIGFYFGGAGFAKNIGENEVSVKLSVFPKDLTEKVWLFGDSYLGWTHSARWLYHILQWGFTSWMSDSLPGINSQNEYVSFTNNILIGKPVYALWLLGMNDGSDTDISTPSSNWLTYIQEFINGCKNNGVIPILATIPSVPSIYHEGKNKWVRESGYRYIDFASAVGATSAGVWKTGMLSSDNVHPTELGAKALASQVLVDFPEITVE